MVRTYWLVPVFNEASGNLDLQLGARRPNRCLSAPCYVEQMVAASAGPLAMSLLVPLAGLLSRVGDISNLFPD
jgi:hypothetical protein